MLLVFKAYHIFSYLFTGLAFRDLVNATSEYRKQLFVINDNTYLEYVIIFSHSLELCCLGNVQ
jgi:hypothetical protein